MKSDIFHFIDTSNFIARFFFLSRNRMKLNLNWIECPEHLLFLVRTCLENRGRAQVSERIHVVVVVVVITARF